MKRYVLPAARVPSDVRNPERSATRLAGTGPMDFDLEVQEWPNRASMARTVRMQERGPSHRLHWSPVVKLSDGEGY